MRLSVFAQKRSARGQGCLRSVLARSAVISLCRMCAGLGTTRVMKQGRDVTEPAPLVGTAASRTRPRPLYVGCDCPLFVQCPAGGLGPAGRCRGRSLPVRPRHVRTPTSAASLSAAATSAGCGWMSLPWFNQPAFEFGYLRV